MDLNNTMMYTERKKQKHAGETFFVAITALRISGLWINKKSSKLLKIIYKIMDTIFFVVMLVQVITSTMGTFMLHGTAIDLLDSLTKILQGYNCTIKAICFYFKRTEIIALVHEIKETNSDIPRQKLQLLKIIILSLYVTVFFILFGFTSTAVLNKKPIHPAWYPFVENIYWEIFLNAAMVVPSLCRLLAIEALVLTVLILLTHKVVMLQKMIKSVQYNPDEDAEFRNNIKDIIKQHSQIMMYTKRFSELFNWFFFTQNFSIIYEVCLNVYMISAIGFHDKLRLINFVVFLILALGNCFIYCYLANELILESIKFSLAAYESSWLDWPLNLRKDLVLIMKVSQRPLHVRAGVDMVSLNVYVKVLYNGYSVYAVLHDMN